MTLSVSQPGVSATAAPAQAVRHAVRMFLTMTFVTALVIPLIGSYFHWDTSASHENRTMAIFPRIPRNFEEVKTYTDRMMDYYRDHFGFRNALIRGRAITAFHGGVGLENSDRVVIGEKGWLFLPAWHDENFMAFRGLDPLNDHQLDQWQSLLERRYRFFTGRGMKYLVVIPPDKQTIYPEYLPETFGDRLGPSRLDQLVERLRETHSPVHLVDLRSALLNAKRSGQIYFKTDTHWNDEGAYAAYCALLPEIQKELPGFKLPLLPLSLYVPRQMTYAGDLAEQLDLYSEFQETIVNLYRPMPFIEIPTFVDKRIQAATTLPESDPEHVRLPRVVTYNDSFMERLYVFLCFDFSHGFYQWGDPVDGSIAVREKPDIVINEFVERKLCAPPPVDYPEVANQP